MKSTKKIIALILALALVTCVFTACSGTAASSSALAESSSAPAESSAAPTEAPTTAPTEEAVELSVFAAASMTESMNTIAEMYKEVAPNVTLVYNFDSSGTLKTQIQEGADCDIFISAGQKQMDQMDSTADKEVNTEGLDFVLQGSRFDIVSNTVVLIVPENSEKGITSFDDVMTDKVSLIALGNSDVPVGQYSEQIFTKMGVWDQLKDSSKVSYGTNVKEVLEQVSSGAVDCGIVYSTDAATATGIKVVATAAADMHDPITYPAAIINTTKNQAAAEAFMEYLKSDACSTVFTGIGFTIPEK